LPFWREADVRLKAIELPATSPHLENLNFLRAVASGRNEALELCRVGLQKGDATIVAQCNAGQGRVDQMIEDRQKRGDLPGPTRP
jgi:hypothetical protein